MDCPTSFCCLGLSLADTAIHTALLRGQSLTHIGVPVLTSTAVNSFLLTARKYEQQALPLVHRMVELLQSKESTQDTTEVTNSLTLLLNGENKSKKAQVNISGNQCAQMPAYSISLAPAWNLLPVKSLI